MIAEGASLVPMASRTENLGPKVFQGFICQRVEDNAFHPPADE